MKRGWGPSVFSLGSPASLLSFHGLFLEKKKKKKTSYGLSQICSTTSFISFHVRHWWGIRKKEKKKEEVTIVLWRWHSIPEILLDSVHFSEFHLPFLLYCHPQGFHSLLFTVSHPLFFAQGVTLKITSLSLCEKMDSTRNCGCWDRNRLLLISVLFVLLVSSSSRPRFMAEGNTTHRNIYFSCSSCSLFLTWTLLIFMHCRKRYSQVSWGY